MLDLNYIRTFVSFMAHRVTKSEEGASMVEYALLLALIAVICIGAVTLLGQSASDKFSSVGNAVSGAGSSTTVAP